MSSNEKSSDEDENMNQEEYVLFEDDILPSTLLWSQTLESITLQIKVVRIVMCVCTLSNLNFLCKRIMYKS